MRFTISYNNTVNSLCTKVWHSTRFYTWHNPVRAQNMNIAPVLQMNVTCTFMSTMQSSKTIDQKILSHIKPDRGNLEFPTCQGVQTVYN